MSDKEEEVFKNGIFSDMFYFLYFDVTFFPLSWLRLIAVYVMACFRVVSLEDCIESIDANRSTRL